MYFNVCAFPNTHDCSTIFISQSTRAYNAYSLPINIGTCTYVDVLYIYTQYFKCVSPPLPPTPPIVYAMLRTPEHEGQPRNMHTDFAMKKDGGSEEEEDTPKAKL